MQEIKEDSIDDVKQKKGKKRMKMIGKVEVPQEALLAVLQIESN